MRTLVDKVKMVIPSRLKNSLVNEVRRSDKKWAISDCIALTEKLNASPADVEYSRQLLTSTGNSNLRSIIWLIPSAAYPYGGVFTILRVGNYLKSKGYENKFVVYNNPAYSSNSNFEVIKNYFFEIAPDDFITIKRSIEQEMPNSDIAIATYWTSCFELLKIRNTRNKIYFIQDFEPLFNPPGTRYALCENTYRFPFHRIANTKGLYDYVNNNYSVDGIRSTYFTPAVDDRFKYAEKPLDKTRKIFFYARPEEGRNGFELGMAFVKRLKEKYGDMVEISIAGQLFDLKELGLEALSQYVMNSGVKNYDELPSFYRSFHIGISFMFTKHPSYIPMELMKSGCLVFTNYNEANLWLFRDGYNCIMASPCVDEMVEKFDWIMHDPAAYLNILRNAYKTVTKFTWEAAFNTIEKFINEL